MFFVNGEMYDWASLELGIAGMPMVSFTSVEYGDSQEVKKVYGKGRKPVGYSRGNYETEGKLTLHREAFEMLELAVPVVGEMLGRPGIVSIYDLPPVPITITYSNKDKPLIADTLKACKFKSRKTSMSQNDEAAEMEIDLEFDEVLWNGRGMKG